MSNNTEGLKKFSLFHVLIVATLAIGLYSNTLKNGFIYDDESTIVNNTFVKSFDNLPLMFDKAVYFSRSAEISYRPVVTFTYFIDYAIYGLKPWGYHLTNVFLHAVNGMLLYLFLTLFFSNTENHKLYIRSRNPLFVSLLFISHPVLSEAVNFISYRDDLLAFMFYMTTLSLYLMLRPPTTAYRPLTTISLYFLSCLAYLFALLSKEMAVTLPLIVFCYEWFYGKDKMRLLSRVLNHHVIGYIAITFFYLYLRFYLFHNPKEPLVEGWGFVERFLTLPWLIVSYIKLSLFPAHLSADYVITPVNSPFSIAFILPIIALILIFPVILIIGNREKKILFGAIFFLITLMPVYNFVPLFNPLAERYLYLPVAGFVIYAVSIAYFIVQKLKQKSAHENYYMPTFLLLLLLIFSFSVVKRNTIWKNSYSLWSDTVAKMPASRRAHHNLGRAYYNRGRIDEATAEFRTAIKLKFNNAEAHNNLGVIYLRQGRYDDAIYELKMAINSKPDYVDAYINLGITHSQQGLIDLAIKELLTAIRLKPDNANAHYNLGFVYSEQGRYDEAINEFTIALKWQPDYKEAYNNLEALMKKRRAINTASGQHKNWSH